MSTPSSSVILLVGILLAPGLRAQADWHTDVVVPKPRAVHTAAYDQGRDEVLVFGGNANAGVQGDTWIWSPQSGWRNARPGSSPPPLREHAMAYDAIRQEIVLFGGWDGSQVVGDTWIWNGTTWRLSMPSTSPSPRMAEMAFDPASGRVLLFGGQDSAGVRMNETWAWDGTNWSQLSPTQVPPARFDHALATDWTRGQVVMFGGWDGAFLGDTWLWTGTDWTSTSAVGPSPRSEHKMAFANGDVVLFAGDSTAGRVQDTWRWNGTAWSLLQPTPRPGVREEHVMADVLSTGALLMFGGWDSATGHTADTWTFQNGQWTELTPFMPIGAGTAAADFDPTSGMGLMFGGYQDQQVSGQTWAYSAGSWTLLSPTTSPPPRAEPAMAFDRVRGEFVMFGGVNGSSYYNDTWVFRGGNWQQKSPTQNPPARWGHAMTFDETRGTTILFSGRLGGSGNNLQDTWEWDGTNWTLLSPSTSPPGREDPGLAFDAGRGVPVLFGGWVGGSGFANDTWEFRNGDWVQLSLPNQPSARSEHSMAYDRVRGRVVVFAGEDQTGRVADTWELTDTDWVQRSPVHAPEPREEAVMFFDERAGEIVMSVGWDLGHYTDTWQYGARPPATSVSYGASCQGSAAAAPVLSSTRPWLGENVLYTTTNVPSGGGAILLFGFMQQSSPLDPIGMPGCILATLPVTSPTMTTVGTEAGLVFPLPATPSLVGIQLYNQSAVVAVGANPLGVLTTNGLELTTALK